jgi:molybdopterin-guanine dinucleotide biosynthesis protein A
MGISISGVILAGGDNKRFGGITKSNIVVGRESIISGIINIIRDLFDEIIIVTNTPEEFREYKQCLVVRDQFLKAGPLGGIHAGLKTASGKAIFALAGDMPFLKKKFIEEQILTFNNEKYDILVPKIGGNIEPLHAIYRKTIVDDIEESLTENKNRPVRDFISEMKTGYFLIQESDENRKAFTNINSPEDIARII